MFPNAPSPRSAKSPRSPRWLLICLALLLLYVLAWVITSKIEERMESQSPLPTIQPQDSILRHAALIDSLLNRPRRRLPLKDAQGRPIVNAVVKLPDFSAAFPDLNPVQLPTAQRLGISSCRDRAEAVSRTRDLVNIEHNPHYHVRNLSYSLPYLVPRAARLLEVIARNFTDSLTAKGKPQCRLMVTSVLRTEADVAKLRRGNSNASEQSCHRYGTTFDISYTKFKPNLGPDGHELPLHDPYELKLILGEVMRDLRAMGACYVKYEVHQSCFHITAR